MATVTDIALTADCSRCFGLCCVLLPITRSADFARGKPGGQPCTHLREDDLCAIHDDLDARGWHGCTVFDCFGAGQQVSQVTYAGHGWRDAPVTEMAAVFSAMRVVHEMLAHVREVRRRAPSPAADVLWEHLVEITGAEPEGVLAVDLDALHDRVGTVLGNASSELRGDGPRPGRDLAGHDLRGHHLRRADLRGALLIGADLRDADLTLTDLLGADLRDADVRGARLDDALFLTQPQVNAARGDASTTLPADLARPTGWNPQMRE